VPSRFRPRILAERPVAHSYCSVAKDVGPSATAHLWWARASALRPAPKEPARGPGAGWIPADPLKEIQKLTLPGKFIVEIDLLGAELPPRRQMPPVKVVRVSYTENAEGSVVSVGVMKSFVADGISRRLSDILNAKLTLPAAPSTWPAFDNAPSKAHWVI